MSTLFFHWLCSLKAWERVKYVFDFKVLCPQWYRGVSSMYLISHVVIEGGVMAKLSLRKIRLAWSRMKGSTFLPCRRYCAHRECTTRSMQGVFDLLSKKLARQPLCYRVTWSSKQLDIMWVLSFKWEISRINQGRTSISSQSHRHPLQIPWAQIR